MAEKSHISWTDGTFNPWMGCTKVSPACKNCYAERDFDHRYQKVKWGPSGTRVVTSDANWNKPLKWDREAKASGIRKRIFCASLADVFEDWQGPIITGSLGEVLSKPHLESANEPRNWKVAWPEDMAKDPQGWRYVTMEDIRVRLFKLIDATPNLDWLLLTKRPENIRRMWDYSRKLKTTRVSQNAGDNIDVYRPNVWLGTSIENQHYADSRIRELIQCREFSPVLFLSCEPLVGPVDLSAWLGLDKDEKGNFVPDFKFGLRQLDWVITGGESGPGARPADPDWFRSIRDQCIVGGVPFHFKQWGEFNDNQVHVGVKNAGRLLDGVEWNGFPKIAG